MIEQLINKTSQDSYLKILENYNDNMQPGYKKATRKTHLEQLKKQYLEECKKHNIYPDIDPDSNPREAYKKNFKFMIEDIFKPKKDVF